MTRKSLFFAGTAALTFLNACTVNVESHVTASSPERRAMTICGLGLIETPDGPKPAIAGMHPSDEVYREYYACVQKLTASERQSRSEDSQ
jgi:hypothetical protein